MSSLPKLVIDGIQTTPPSKVTDPKISFKISTTPKAFNPINAFNKYSHIIFYYKKLGGEESGWFHGGWIKATLGKALSEQPLLGGRLRRVEDGEGGGFEIVSNDSGVRVLEARVQIGMEEFIEMQKNEGEVASVLLHFKDVDEENLQFCPLIYVQVTSFKCGGYSLGITYNLLLADPFLMESFLKRWAEIHKNTIFDSNIPKMPLFYLPNLKKMENPPPELVVLKPSKDFSTNVAIFEVAIVGDPSYDKCNSIVLRCIEEAESMVGVKMSLKFTLLVKEASGNVRVDVTSKASLAGRVESSKCALKCLELDDLGAQGIAFWQGNAPALVSRYVGSVGGGGLISLVISPKDDGKLGMNALVAFPSSDALKECN